MGRYEELVGSVRERLGGGTVDEVREAVARTAAGLVLWLPAEERVAFRDALPAPLRPADVEDARTARGSAGVFLRFVADREGRPPDRVRYEVRAVLSAFEAAEPEVARRLRGVLPDDFAELFQAPGGGPPADLAAAAGGPRRSAPSPPPERELSPPRPPAQPVPGTSHLRSRDKHREQDRRQDREQDRKR